MYNILVEKNKNLFKMETKEELEKKVISFNEHCKDLSEKTNIKLFKTDSQGNIKAEIRLSLPEKKEDLDYYLEGFDEEKDEISHCLEKFCLEKEEANEEKEEAYKQQQETKLKEEVDNKELDENEKEVLKTLKNLRNQDSEDIQVEVVPSAKEKQRQIREKVEKNKREKDEERPEPEKEEEKEVEEAKTEVIENEKDVELDEEVKEKLEDKQLQTSQNQELVTNNKKENIIYVPKNVENAKSIMFRAFQTALGETQREIDKIEKIIEQYQKQILEHKKAEKKLKEELEKL